MFDSPSDAILSDLEFDQHANSQEISNLKQENQKLIYVNRDLAKQLKILREQFDQALTVTANLEDRFAQHNETVRKLEEVKLERDDFKDRLDMSNRTISDLTSQIQELRKNMSLTSQSPILTQKIAQLQDQLKQMTADREQAHNQSVAENEKHAKSMKSVLKAISSFTGTNLCDAPAVISFLKRQKHSYARVLKMLKKVEKENGSLYQQIAEVSHLNEENMQRVHILEERNHELTLSANISPRKMANTTSEIFTQANLNSTRIGNSEMEETVTEQRDTIDALRSERNKLTNLLERQSELTRALEQKLAAAETENQEIRKELKETRQKLRKATKFENNDPNIPLSFWQCPDFPEELMKLVEEIAKNGSMQIPTKIRHALTTVNSWYAARQVITEREAKEQREALSELTKQSATLIEYLRHVMPFDIDFSKLMSDEYTRISLGKKLSDLQNQVQDYTAEIDQMKGVMDTLNVDDAATAVDAIKNLRRVEEENQNLRNRVHEQEVAYKKQIEELKDSLDSQKDAFAREINELKSDVRRKKEKIGALKAANEQVKVHAESQQQETIQAITTEFQAKISNLNENNEKLLLSKNDELEILQGELKSALVEIDECKKVIYTLKRRKHRAENDFQTCNEQKQSLEEAMKKKIKSQKEKSQQRMNEVLEKLKQNAAESNTTINNLTAKIADLEEKNASLASQFTDVSLKLQKSETRATTVAAERERDKKQIESTFTAKIQSIELNCKQQIEAAVSSHEAWRKRIYGNVALILAKYIDGTRQIDDFNFESCMQTVKRKLDVATSTNSRIRGMLELGPYENMESAIEALVNSRKKSRN